MKIGIITLNGYFNYGNRLQNYSLQQILIDEGYAVETVVFEISNRKKKNEKAKLINCNRLKRIIYNCIKKKVYYKINLQKQNIFKQFTEKNIFEKHIKADDYEMLVSISQEYDFFITGSDQVWNPNYNFGSSIYFLTFAEKHKRIAYAPSFGVSEIKPEFVENYKEWISGMNRLSVREDDGAKIIKDLTGRDAPVLVDPTLLLTREKWLSIAKEASNKPKGKYLLTYFLGGIPDNYKKQIKNIVKENGLEVINLGDIREKETYITGPSEFIDYINNCSILCTDSFHGTAFSILFEKPFIVFERIGSTSMYSRIDTLLNKFKLNYRKAENMAWGEDVFNIDFSHIPSILSSERKKAIDYLNDALNVKDE